MAYQVGYWSALSGLKFEEIGDNMVSTFMAMPYGKYNHPVYGEIEFNQEKARQAADHITQKSRGTDLDIDYDHKQHSGEAAGWVKAAEARANGLYLTVEWTKKAAQLIRDKAYRYFSPEFADEWKHPKTGQVHKNLLFGGGITNRPFLKDILPLNMSELFEEQAKQKEEGTGMDPKKLRKLLGLPEDATDDQVNEAMNAVPDDHVIGEPPKVEEPEKKPIAASDDGLPDEVKKLAEDNPAIKLLTDMVTSLQQTVQDQGAKLQFAEAAGVVRKLSDAGNGRQLPTGTQKLLSEALTTPTQENVAKLVEAINKTGYVKLGEDGSQRSGGGDNKDATQKLHDAVVKLMEADKALSYGDAMEQVVAMNEELYSGHREGSYAFKTQD